jgi:hypothetical protein
MLKLVKKGVEAMTTEGESMDDQVVEKVERLDRGYRSALVSGNEAIEQVETAARKKRDELAEKQLSKNYQSRKGGLMTAQEGREIWSEREIKEQTALQRKADRESALWAREKEEREAECATAALEAAEQAREYDDDGVDYSRFGDPYRHARHDLDTKGESSWSSTPWDLPSSKP